MLVLQLIDLFNGAMSGLNLIDAVNNTVSLGIALISFPGYALLGSKSFRTSAISYPHFPFRTQHLPTIKSFSYPIDQMHLLFRTS